MTPKTTAAQLAVEALETREVPATMLAVNQAGRLLTFDSANPSVLQRNVPITGLATATERVTDIDVRPGSGVLFGRSDADFLYTINPFTGAATRLPGRIDVASPRVGLDFDPTTDRLRLAGNAGENIGLDPNTGGPVVIGRNLNYAPGDVAQGQAPRVVGLGFTNSLPFALTTTGYGIDHVRNTLVRFNGPVDGGQLVTVGSLGFDTTALVGLDIAAGSTFAFATLRAPGATSSSFAIVSLATGAATVIGPVGNFRMVSDIAILSGGLLPIPGSFLSPTNTFSGTTTSPLFPTNVQPLGPGVIGTSFGITGSTFGGSSLTFGG